MFCREKNVLSLYIFRPQLSSAALQLSSAVLIFLGRIAPTLLVLGRIVVSVWVLVWFIHFRIRCDVGQVDLDSSDQDVHHVLDLLEVTTDLAEVTPPRPLTAATREKVHGLLQVNIGHVGKYQLLSWGVRSEEMLEYYSCSCLTPDGAEVWRGCWWRGERWLVLW